MTSPSVAHDSPGAVLQLIRSGAVSFRNDLAKSLGISASTAGLRIRSLIDHGYVREEDDGRPNTGRRPRRLSLRPDFGAVATIDLDINSTTIGLFDMCGNQICMKLWESDISDGPKAVLQEAYDEILLESMDPGLELRGIAVGVPGPVDSRTGFVVSPSRMPGWHKAHVAYLMSKLTTLPVIVDNDANLRAVAEYIADPVDHLVFVKAGTGIGCGVIASGRPHRGAVGAAGDISHLPVPGREEVRCSCGRNGCLDAVASSDALDRDLAAAGVSGNVVKLAGDSHPTATRMLREAGHATGEILATVVNFFNPDALVIGGPLSRADAFVGSVRATVYERCLPMATEHLQVRTSRKGVRAGVTGGAHLMLEHLLAPERVNEVMAASS
jgi:predicted NBD/HSP70 family sugar kinase